MPQNRSASMRWRRVALLMPDEFEARIERATRKAFKAISSSGAAVAAPEKVTTRPRRGKTAAAAVPRPIMKLSPWQQDADGSLSRTLSAELEGETLGSTAGA
jgi:hypothetical protein